MCAALMQQNSFPQNGGLPNLTPSEFDYTFTDRELQDILGFMELQQTQGPGQEPPTSAPAFFPASSPSGLGLQFQPHPPQTHPVGSVPVHAFDQKYVGSKGDAPSSSSAYGSGLAPLNGGLANTGGPATRSSSMSQGPTPAPLPDKRPSLQPAQSFGTTGSKADREPKQHVSHSTVEKQRRDRINSLIDELRDLVPPQPLSSQQEGLENKRPKHVVLSDTIALVRELQDKARLGEVNQPLKQEDEALDLMRRSYPENSVSRSDQSGSPHTNSGPDLPLAPEGAPVSSGVVVEQGESCLYVKVNCKDRRGLLGDIIMALKAMPLEITTAAITTTQDGNVYDVFQVKLDADHSTWSAHEVQCQVHSNLYSNFMTAPGDKRRRMLQG